MGADRFGQALTAVDLRKAEFYGIEYIYDSVIAWLGAEMRRKQYEYYLTDALKAIAENTSRGGGVTLRERFADMVEDHNEEPEPEQHPEEIKAKIINEFKRLRGEL